MIIENLKLYYFVFQNAIFVYISTKIYIMSNKLTRHFNQLIKLINFEFNKIESSIGGKVSGDRSMTAALPLTTPPPITMSFAIDSEFQQSQTNN